MADKKILEIPVETEQWDSFVESFHNWQSELEKTNGAWAGTNRGVRELGTAFDHVETTFNDLVEKATASKFSSPTNGVFTRVDKTSKETAKSWQNIAKEIEKAGRGLTGIARNGGMGVFGLFGAAGVLAGGLYGATAGAANSVAGDFKSGRQLGLELGKEKEFGIAGEPYGLGRDALEEAANAKADPTKQLPFMNAGVSAQDFATKDAAELAWQKARGEAQLYSQWEKTSPQFAVAQAQSYFPGENPDQLRLLADALDKGDLDKAQQQYEQNWQKVGYTQQQGEDATKFKQDQAQKWADIETAWNKDILLLAPHLDKWSTAAEKLVVGFLDNSAKTVNDLANAGDNPTPPGTEPPPAASNDIPARITRGTAMVGQWLQEHGLTNPFDGAGAGAGTPAGQPGFTADPDKAAHMAALENIWSMPKGLLQADENIESSGGTNNINPNNPNVLGAFQFDQPTADKYGVIRTDEYSSEAGAARYLADLKKRYGSWDKAVAAFDGFAGLDRDIAKYGDAWKDHISEFQKSGETSKYLRKLADQGIDLSGGKTPFDDPKNIALAKASDPNSGKHDRSSQQKPFDDPQIIMPSKTADPSGAPTPFEDSKALKAAKDVEFNNGQNDLGGTRSPFDDPKNIETAKAIDQLNDPRIVPMDAVDQQALDAQSKTQAQSDQEYVSETLIDRLKRGFSTMGDYLSTGGGAQFATPSAPARTTTQTTPQQFNIQMQVTAPAGSDVQVTGAQLAQ